jgi:hypothetical protein
MWPRIVSKRAAVNRIFLHSSSATSNSGASWKLTTNEFIAQLQHQHDVDRYHGMLDSGCMMLLIISFLILLLLLLLMWIDGWMDGWMDA